MANIWNLFGVGQALGHHSPLNALPHAINTTHSTSRDFVEN